MSNQVWYVTSQGGYVTCESATAKLPAQAYASEYYSREDKVQLCVRELQTENKYLFPNSVSHDIVRAITTFWDNAIIYSKMGLRHQRGILLHGEPGMGKTAIAQIVGQQIIEQDGLFLICEDFDDFIDGIEVIRQTEPNRPMVGFIEDVDSYISSNEEDIVALLDGAKATKDGIVYLMTTNNLDAIPDRIKHRPSRVDALFEVVAPGYDVRLLYVSHLLANISGMIPNCVQLATEIAKHTENYSLAVLKEVVLGIIVYDLPLEVAVARCQHLVGNKDG